MEEMAPLLVYICSCINFCGRRYNDLIIKLRFDHTELTLDNSINVFADLFRNPLNIINENNDQTRSFGFCTCFSEPFRLELSLEQDSESPYIEKEDEEEIEEEEETINELKTFKFDNCVICLENKPSVLFCNCGHLCVCKECIKRFTKCPICKKENTILRIIE